MTTKFTLLITTALPNKVRFESKNIIFLGEWCKNYSKNNVYSDESFTVIPYHWKDRSKLQKDHEYLFEFYEKLLSELCIQLNKTHGVKHTKRYWRIVIGPWLLMYLPVLWDRWESVNKACNDGYDK